MTILYQLNVGNDEIEAAADAIANEYEVPVTVMRDALEDFAIDEINTLIANLRDRAQAQPRFFERYVERRLALYRELKKYEIADL